MNVWQRKQRRVIDAATAIFTIVVLASVVSPVVENAVGVIVTVILAGLVIRGLWPHTVGEWRRDRALIREVGEWDDPRTPIVLLALDGTETIIGPNEPEYPAALAQRTHAAEVARRSRQE